MRPDHPPRPLGADGPVVSALGLGLAALGRPAYLNLGHGEDLAAARGGGGAAPSVVALEARAHEVLDAAWRGGVRYLDAARSYGRAEAFLAGWLAARAIDADAVVVGSKWGYAYTAAWRVDAERHEVKDHAAGAFERQWPESQALLGDHLDLYQIHSVTPESPALDDARLLALLADLKGRGVRIGLSTSGPGQAATIDRAIDARVDGVRLFDAVQATWNPLEPSAAPALAEARAAGLGVIVKEALANGRLTDRHLDDPDGGRAAAGALRAEAARLGTTVDALALAAALAQPWADVVLSGASTTAQLASNLRSLDVAWDDAAAAALGAVAETPEAYWRGRAALPWT